MSLYIDLSEFLAVPMKTGIQRIGGEMCRYAPPQSMIPIRLHNDRYLSFPFQLISAIGRYFRSDGNSEVKEINKLSAFENGSPVTIKEEDIVVVPEIFTGQRADFFHRMSAQQLKRYRFLVFDVLPATHPEFFLPDMPVILCEYFHVVRRATNNAFISEYTRDVFHQRLKRTAVHEGVVLPLGSDALGPRPAVPSLNRPLTFSVLGTIEPRKNHRLILEAFEPLLSQIDGLSLSFVGKMGWVDSEFAQKVRTLAADPKSGFRFLPAVPDGAIHGCIERSRATIYVSAAEGYGLPPVESLWLGTPVIASTMIPSLERLGSTGIHYVDPLTPENLRQTVFEFLNDDYANRKTLEAAQLTLPTWQSFTQEALRWCAERQPT